MHLQRYHLTLVLAAALLLGGASMGFTAEEQQQAVEKRGHEAGEGEVSAAVAGDDAGQVLQPQPLVEDSLPVTSRNPFDEPVNAMIFDDYATILARISLRGVVGVDGRTIGLFIISEAGGDHQEAGTLQRYERGEIIPVYQGRKEYLFTLQALEQRSAVLHGGDGKTYRVWL